jgi:hypothetical protein
MYFNSKYRRTQRPKRKKNRIRNGSTKKKEKRNLYFHCRTEKSKDLRERAKN